MCPLRTRFHTYKRKKSFKSNSHSYRRLPIRATLMSTRAAYGQTFIYFFWIRESNYMCLSVCYWQIKWTSYWDNPVLHFEWIGTMRAFSGWCSTHVIWVNFSHCTAVPVMFQKGKYFHVWIMIQLSLHGVLHKNKNNFPYQYIDEK